MKIREIILIAIVFITTNTNAQNEYVKLKRSKNISELSSFLNKTKSKRKKQEIEHRLYNAKRDEMFIQAKRSLDTNFIASYISLYENPAYSTTLKGCNYTYGEGDTDITYLKNKINCIEHWRMVLEQPVSDTLFVTSFITNFSTCELCEDAKDSLYERRSRFYFNQIIRDEAELKNVKVIDLKISNYMANFKNREYLEKLKNIQFYNEQLYLLINSEKSLQNVSKFISLDPYNPRVNSIYSELRMSCTKLDKTTLRSIQNLPAEKLIAYTDSIFSEEGKMELIQLLDKKAYKNMLIHSFEGDKSKNYLRQPTDMYSVIWFYNFTEEPMIVQLDGENEIEIIVEPNSKKVKTIKNGFYNVKTDSQILGKNEKISKELIYRDGMIIKGIFNKNSKLISNNYEPTSSK
jgi:hypothetical protein